MRILVVEDEMDLAQAVIDHLRAAGHAVDHAAPLADVPPRAGGALCADLAGPAPE